MARKYVYDYILHRMRLRDIDQEDVNIQGGVIDDVVLKVMYNEEVPADTPTTITHNFGRPVVPYACINTSGELVDATVSEVGLNSFKVHSLVAMTVYYR